MFLIDFEYFDYKKNQKEKFKVWCVKKSMTGVLAKMSDVGEIITGRWKQKM